MYDIKLKGPTSTVAVMDWIEEHGCPELHGQFFRFEPVDAHFIDTIVVSSVEPDDTPVRPIIARTPVEEWHQVKPNQRRHAVSARAWYACICGKLYWITA